MVMRPRGWTTMAVAGLAGLASLVGAACGSSDDVDTAAATAAPGGASLEGTNWVLSEAPDIDVPLDEVTVSARFEDGTVGGTSGCNTYNGPYELDGENLTIGPNLASTQIACQDPQAAVEQAYLAALPEVATYAISEQQLTLSNGDGDAILVFDASIGAEAIVGSWTVTSYYAGDAVTSVLSDVSLTADFADGTVSGSGGCNRYNGPYEVDGDAITIGPLVSTKIGCEEEIATQEGNFLAALELATSFAVTGDRLELFRDGGTIAATFDKA